MDEDIFGKMAEEMILRAKNFQYAISVNELDNYVRGEDMVLAVLKEHVKNKLITYELIEKEPDNGYYRLTPKARTFKSFKDEDEKLTRKTLKDRFPTFYDLGVGSIGGIIGAVATMLFSPSGNQEDRLQLQQLDSKVQAVMERVDSLKTAPQIQDTSSFVPLPLNSGSDTTQ